MKYELMEAILSQPSAPFREKHVANLCTARLAAARVPHFFDPVGNIVVGVGSATEYRRLLGTRSREPVRLFMAHMDHPGFHGVRWRNPRTLEVKWLGGSPRRFLNGASVWLADGERWRGEGRFAEAELLDSGAALKSGVVRLSQSVSPPIPAKEIFGGFRFRKPIWKKGRTLYTKAADDLVGASVVLTLGMERARYRGRAAGPAFLGLLTRAEEVGFIGAIGHFELDWWERKRRGLLCISLETSRQLPGAEIGKGPVVRLGDRATTFHPGALNVFSRLAREVLPGRHQRRIMDGGTCEGTVATAYGFPTVGISIPLGNYHNQSFEGGPDSRGPLGPAPEFVNLDDIEGMHALCRALLRPGLDWDEPFASLRKQFQSSVKSHAGLLELR